MENNNINGYGYGYWNQPIGYQVQQPDIPKQESTLSAEQIKEMRSQMVDQLNISDNDILVARCNHVDINGNDTWYVVDKSKNLCHCTQCGAEWIQQDFTEDGAKSVVFLMNNLINSVKTSSRGSIPKEFAIQFYTAQAMMQKIPEIIKICNKNLISSEKLLQKFENAQNIMGNFRTPCPPYYQYGYGYPQPPVGVQQGGGNQYGYGYPQQGGYQNGYQQPQPPVGVQQGGGNQYGYGYPQQGGYQNGYQQPQPPVGVQQGGGNQFVQGGVTPQPTVVQQPQFSRIPAPGTTTNISNTNNSNNTEKK